MPPLLCCPCHPCCVALAILVVLSLPPLLCCPCHPCLLHCSCHPCCIFLVNLISVSLLHFIYLITLSMLSVCLPCIVLVALALVCCPCNVLVLFVMSLLYCTCVIFVVNNTTTAKLKPVWNGRSISLSSNLQLMHSLVTSIFLYAFESRTLTAELQRRIQTMEMRCSRKILRMSYKYHVTNEEVRAKIQQAI